MTGVAPTMRGGESERGMETEACCASARGSWPCSTLPQLVLRRARLRWGSAGSSEGEDGDGAACVCVCVGDERLEMLALEPRSTAEEVEELLDGCWSRWAASEAM